MMGFLRKKRVFAALLLIVIAIMFYYTDWIGKLLYPVKFEDEIQLASNQHGVEPYLVAAIIRVESNYRVDMTSKKGAQGLMQIMPETAGWIVQTAGYPPKTMDVINRPDVNIEIGAWYLKSLTGQLRADGGKQEDGIAVVAAAYNAGPGNVNKWITSGRWDGTYAELGQIPFGETRHYVQRVIYYYNKYKQFYEDDWE